MPQDLKVTAELRNWTMYVYGPYNIIWGDCFGDTKDRFKDGSRIHTSEVHHMIDEDDHFLCVTLNSVYLLKKNEEVASVTSKRIISTDFPRYEEQKEEMEKT